MHPTLAMAAALAAAHAAPVQVLPAAQIEAQVLSALSERAAAVSSGARVRLQGGLRDQTLPAGQASVRIGEIAGRWPRARVAVPVRLLVDGRTVRTLTMRAELSDEREVLAYAAAYAARHGAAGLRWAPAVVDMICCAGDPLAEGADLGGERLKRAVRAGQPVMSSDFEAMPEVAAHETVSIEVESGRIRLASSGVALRDGRIGDRIGVRASASGQTVQARVVAKQKVRIDE